MNKKLFSTSFLIILLLAFCVAATASPAQNERFAIRAMRTLHSAEVTYQATTGAGNYTTLTTLGQENLIDAVLSSGTKYGYTFQITSVAQNGTTPAAFYVSARPANYRKSGVKSFYIDQTGVLRGGDKSGAAATVSDFIIDTDCVPYEECAISSLRTLYSAEITYAATVGNGNYANFQRLYDANLISRILWVGTRGGYTFSVLYTDAVSGTSPAFFTLGARPIQYGSGSRRSFYIDVNGVLRGADKNGAPATVNDPPIE